MAGRGRMSGGVVVSLIGLAALIIFMFQNTEKIRVHFLSWYFDVALWLLILIAAVVGNLAWFGFGVIRGYRRR